MAEEDLKVSDWQLQIELAERRFEQYQKRCDKIVKRYLDEREENDSARTAKRMNILWSNIETLKPSLYGREPVPIAERRFLDKDVTGRVAAQMLERSLRYEMAFCGFHDTLEAAVQDYCLTARAVAWLRFVPTFGEASSLEPRGEDQLADAAGDVEDDRPVDGEKLTDDQTQDDDSHRLLGASIEVDYVDRKDILHSDARTWKEVEWIAKRVFMGRGDLIARFGYQIARDVPLEMGPDEKSKPARSSETPETMKKAIVWEIWFKPERRVYFVAKGFGRFLDVVDDPLNLEGFWPCPRPLYGTRSNDSLIPVPDYAEYQDQAEEIDNLTQRMDALMRALKVAGCYDANVKELGRLYDEGKDLDLVPVASWAAFGQKGGLQGAISFLPLKEVADVLQTLSGARQQLKQDLYEITGLADIMRGQSDPRETAEAVRTKGRFGTLRLQQRQKDVARFCRDIIAMMGEIISEHFPTETLINTSGVMYDDGIGPEMPVAPKPPSPPAMGAGMGPAGTPTISAPRPALPAPGPQQPGPAPPAPSPMQPPPPSPQQQYVMAMQQYQVQLQAAQQEKMRQVLSAIDLLRQDKLRGFRIDIETDSTIVDEASEERQDRVAFLQAASGYLREAMPAGQQYPQMVPLLAKMMMFGIRGFRTGRDIENAFDSFIDQAEKDAKQAINNPSPPPPNPEMIKAQAASEKAKAEIEAQQIEARSEQTNAQMDLEGKKIDLQIAQQKSVLEQQAAAAAHDQKMSELVLQRQLSLATHKAKIRELSMQQRASLIQATPRVVKAPQNAPVASRAIKPRQSGRFIGL